MAAPPTLFRKTTVTTKSTTTYLTQSSIKRTGEGGCFNQSVAYGEAKTQMEPQNNGCNLCRDAASAEFDVQNNLIFFMSP